MEITGENNGREGSPRGLRVYKSDSGRESPDSGPRVCVRGVTDTLSA